MNNTITLFSETTKSHNPIDFGLVFFSVLLSILVLVRDLGYADIPQFVFILYVTIACIVLPYKSLKPFSFFLLTFWWAIHGLGALAVFFALIIKSGKWNGKQILFTILILSLELISFATYSFTVEINKFIVYAIMISMFFYILFDDTDDEENLRKCIKWFILGTVIVISIIIIHYITLFSFEVMLMGGMRIGGDDDIFIQGEADTTRYAAMNANTLAYCSITAFALALIVKDVFKTQATRWICILLLLVAGLLSTSRTWLLVLAIVLFFYFVYSNTKGKLGLAVFAGLLLLLAVQYTDYSEAFTSRFEDRMSSQNIESAGERTELLDAYNTFLHDNPDYLLMGTGAIYYKKVCHVWNSVHNGTQQILVCYGILGILVFVACVYVFYKCYIRKRKIPFLYYVPFLGCFLFDQSIQFLNPVQLMFPFLATLLPMKLYKFGSKNVK